MCNELDQQVRQVTKRSAQRSVDSLGAGIRCDLGRQARQQPAQRLRPMALHAEEVLQLADHPFYDLALAGRPTTIGLRPRPAGVVVRGGGHQSPVLLQPAPLPLHPRKPFVCQIRFVTVAGHEGVCYGPLVGGGRGQPEGGDDAPRIDHQGHLEAVDPFGLGGAPAEGSESSSARDRCKARNSGSRARTQRLNWPWEQSFGKYSRRCAQAKRQKSLSLLKRGHWARIARVMTSGSVSKAGRPGRLGARPWPTCHQSSTNTYNETKKESRSMRHHLWAKV